MIGFLAFAAVAADTLPLQAMHNFGACVVSTTAKGARETLAMDFRTPEYRTRLRALVKGHGRCVPGSSIGSSPLMFAGSLAEALLKSDIKPNDLPQRLALKGQIPPRSPTEEMALCAVETEPSTTVKVLATEPGSPEEQAAMQPLIPLLTSCLPKENKLTANRPAMRALVALAAWRIASTPRSAAQ